MKLCNAIKTTKLSWHTPRDDDEEVKEIEKWYFSSGSKAIESFD